MYYLLQESCRNLQYQYKEALILGPRQESVFLSQSRPSVLISHKTLEIMRLCDGCHDFYSIENSMAQIYFTESADAIRKYVNDCLVELVQENRVILIDEPLAEPAAVTVTGSKDYWTPAHIFLELTNVCPLSCRHCLFSSAEQQIMDRFVLHSVINDLGKMQVDTVCITGGDPLLHPLFRDTVKALLERNIKVNVTTSGYINDENIYKVLQLITPDKGYIQVGLDGLEKTHAAICGKSDSFVKSIGFIRQMLARKLKVTVAITYVNQRFDELDELCNYMKVLGVSAVKLRTAEVSDNNIEFKACELIRVMGFGNYLKDKYENAVFKVEYENRWREMPERPVSIGPNPAPVVQKGQCGAGRDLFVISPLGYIRECVLNDTVVGRVSREQSFLDFLRANSETIYLNKDKKDLCVELCSLASM